MNVLKSSLIALGLAAAVTSGPGEAADAQGRARPAIASAASTAADAIEQRFAALKAAKKPLPAWAADIALRAYNTWRTYKNGAKVEEAVRIVEAVLKEVEALQHDLETKRAIDDRVYRVTRELLDSLGRDIDRLGERVTIIEAAIRQEKKRQRAWMRYNRVCTVAVHVWRPSLGRCVHISNAGPRR